MVSHPAQRAALVFALTFPSLLTYLYFVQLAASPAWLQQITYAVGKTVQFAFPVVWVIGVLGERFTWRTPRTNGVAIAFGFGALVAISMCLLYYGWWQPEGLLEPAEARIRNKIASLGLDTTWKYAVLGLFYVSCHSLLEEYYWRWFVFRHLRIQCALVPAITISSIGFMAHHVILLATYFGWESPITYFFSIPIAMGGAFWAWSYDRYRSLYGPWLSHGLVDAAIFWIGFAIARQTFVG